MNEQRKMNYSFLYYQRNEDKLKYLFLNYRRNEDEAKYLFVNYQRNEGEAKYLILKYRRNEDEAKYLFLNYWRNEDEDEAKYSSLNYRWFNINSIVFYSSAKFAPQRRCRAQCPSWIVKLKMPPFLFRLAPTSHKLTHYALFFSGALRK